MPKRVFKIPAFNRGVVSNASPRDIPDDALAYAENVDSRVAGKVRGIPENETVNASFDARVMAAGTGSKNLLIGQDSSRQFKQYDIDADTVSNVGSPTGNYAYSMVPYGNAVYAGMSDAWRDGDATEPQWVGPVKHVQFYDKDSNSFIDTDITSTDTTFTGTGVGDISAGDYIITGDDNKEIMLVTNRSISTLTVERGKLYTEASSHSSGTLISVVAVPDTEYTVTHAECKNYQGTDTLIENSITFQTVSADGYFNPDTTYFYGFSFVYDGFQESPLMIQDSSGAYFSASPITDNYTTCKLDITIQFDNKEDFSSRITAINIYRSESLSTDSPLDDYNLVQSLSITTSNTTYWWDSISRDFSSAKTYAFNLVYSDSGQSGASYTNNAGLPESLEDTYVNYKIASSYGGYLFAGDCSKDGIPNADKYIFRSLPKNFSAINWIQDFTILPEVPTALAGFNGRLYAFSDSNMYRINPFTMSVEDDYAGVGSLNDRTVVATNYGMFHADSEDIYVNDGRTSQSIGTPIQTVQFGGNAYGWQEIAKTGNGQIASLTFDADNKRLLAFGNVDATTNICWAYDIERQQWQLYTDIDMPAGLTVGTNGTLYATDGTSLKSLFTSSTRKNWKIVTKDFDLGSDSGDFWAYDLQGYGEGNFTIKYLKDGSSTATDNGTTTTEGLRKSTVASADKKMKSIALQVESAATTDELDNLTVQFRPQVIRE